MGHHRTAGGRQWTATTAATWYSVVLFVPSNNPLFVGRLPDKNLRVTGGNDAMPAFVGGEEATRRFMAAAQAHGMLA